MTNEKYAGVALLQKTFVEDVLKHKVVKNNGQRDKVVVLNSHMAIISPEEFIKTQEKLAREGHRYNDFFEKYVN